MPFSSSLEQAHARASCKQVFMNIEGAPPQLPRVNEREGFTFPHDAFVSVAVWRYRHPCPTCHNEQPLLLIFRRYRRVCQRRKTSQTRRCPWTEVPGSHPSAMCTPLSALSESEAQCVQGSRQGNGPSGSGTGMQPRQRSIQGSAIRSESSLHVKGLPVLFPLWEEQMFVSPLPKYSARLKHNTLKSTPVSSSSCIAKDLVN